MIIEDDYDFDFNYDTSPILPLASYAKGQNIFYLGSLSKTISNALRVGFICAPSQAINQISNLRRLIDLRGDTFFELAMSDFIKQGEFTRHLRRANRIYRDRRNLMFELLMSELGDVISIRKPPGGMALWTVFENSIDLRSLAVAAANKGIVISDGSFYDTGRKTLNSTRFGFASVNEHEIVQFVDGLKSCIRRMRK
jgi:GntR family transcriptional regulator/MocR family aminotransferase